MAGLPWRCRILGESGLAFLRAQGRILLGAGRQAREFHLEVFEISAPFAKVSKVMAVHQLPDSNRRPNSPMKPDHHRRVERNQENAIFQIQS